MRNVRRVVYGCAVGAICGTAWAQSPARPASDLTHSAITFVNITQYGAIGDGAADDSRPIQAALNTAARVYVPCGDFAVGTGLKIPSDVEFFGQGECSKIVALPKLSSDPNWTTATGEQAHKYSILSNATYGGSGNSSIYVHGLSFDMSAFNLAHPTYASQTLGFVNVNNVRVEHITTYRGQDGIFFLRSHTFIARANTLVGHVNAAMDSWDGNSDFIYEDNHVDGSGAVVNSSSAIGTGHYGVLVTGIDSIGVAQMTHDAKILRNTIVNVTGNGVWVQGGCASNTGTPQCGQSNGVLVAGNNITNVTEYGGIRFSESHLSTAIDNIIVNARMGCIDVISENPTIGFDDGINITDNTCKDTVEGGGLPAIDIGPAATSPIIRGNRVYGSPYTYAVSIAAGVRGSVIQGNNLAAGTAGTVRDLGIGTFYDGL